MHALHSQGNLESRFLTAGIDVVVLREVGGHSSCHHGEEDFPSTFSRAMLLNSKMVLAFCCLGIETATALCHSEGMVCLVQVILIRVHSSFSTPGQLLYSFYNILFGPGAEADLAAGSSA